MNRIALQVIGLLVLILPSASAAPVFEIRRICTGRTDDCVLMPLASNPTESRPVSETELLELDRDQIRFAQIVPTEQGEQLWIQIDRSLIDRLNRMLDDSPARLAFIVDRQVIATEDYLRDPANDVLKIQSSPQFAFSQRMTWLKELPSSSEAAKARKPNFILITWVALLLFAVGLGFFIRKLLKSRPAKVG